MTEPRVPDHLRHHWVQLRSGSLTIKNMIVPVAAALALDCDIFDGSKMTVEQLREAVGKSPADNVSVLVGSWDGQPDEYKQGIIDLVNDYDGNAPIIVTHRWYLRQDCEVVTR